MDTKNILLERLQEETFKNKKVLPSWAQKLGQQFISQFKNPSLQHALHETLLNPIFDAVIEKLFPYFISFVIIFIGMFLLILCIFVITLRTVWSQKNTFS